ncbi:MAG: HIT family protein [Pseudomonadota bacterium]
MVNATFQKFGWPGTRIAETAHWGVMLRPEQPTLGSLVLACKQPVQAFGEVDAAGFADLGVATTAIEKMLIAAIGYDKINYLMLMMVDPDVHFHVLPRYDGARSFEGLEIADQGWPGPPVLAEATAPDQAGLDALAAHLKRHWPLPG